MGARQQRTKNQKVTTTDKRTGSACSSLDKFLFQNDQMTFLCDSGQTDRTLSALPQDFWALQRLQLLSFATARSFSLSSFVIFLTTTA